DANVACSNRGDERAFEPLRAPDIKGPTYSYWLNTTTEPNENLAALMLGRGNFVVSTSRGHLTDVVHLPPGGSLVVVLDNGTRAIPV
ncbi:CSS-motif domain-containing protein, partial [Pseudomonas sp. SIMBA_064]